MSDLAKVRLVRCPTCENLLPELPDYSVYQCGGCGTVLRAKSLHEGEDSLSEKLGEEKLVVVPVSEKSGNSMGSDMAVSSDASDTNVKSSSGLLSCDKTGSGKDDSGLVEKCKNQSNVGDEKRVLENDLNKKINRDGLGSSGRKHAELNSPYIGSTSGHGRSGRILDWKMEERDQIDRVQRNSTNNIEAVRFSTSNCPKEGPSNSRSDSFLGYRETMENYKNINGVSEVSYLDQDRAEILRKLDELKDQLSRSYNVLDDERKGSVPADPFGSSKSKPMHFGLENHVAGPSYANHCPEPFPFTNGHEMAMPCYYSSQHNQNDLTAIRDPFGSQNLRRAPYHFPNQYQQPSQPYFSGRCIGTNPVPFEPYPCNQICHQPSCSCFNCYNRSFLEIPNNPVLFNHENSALGVNKSRPYIPPFNLHDQKFRTKFPADLNSETRDCIDSFPTRVVLSSVARHCLPVAGGAPFLTCYNCFKVLKLTEKILHMSKKLRKIRCGACSAVVSFSFLNKKLVLSDQTETKRIANEVNSSSIHGHVNRTNVNLFSDNYDESGYDFQSIDREPILQSFHSSSPSISDDETSPEVLVLPSNNFPQPIEPSPSPPPPGSPLQVYFDYSSNNRVVNQFDKGNLSSRSDQEKVKTNKVTSHQNSLKELSLATEMEVSFNECSNTGVSQDDESRINKKGQLFFTNIIKKSFRTNQMDENGRSNVSVNGHLIPARLVKKAEKLAGPIHPGKYWYDFRAGFWGVMGGHCLGIIPPFIEEFNYAMPENCAGGNTGVFVNGRELHEKDFDLLASRGLPTTRDRSYIIEISGTVLDEDTGEELDSLGKLAPTVEKVGHGFGMKTPKAAS